MAYRTGAATRPARKATRHARSLVAGRSRPPTMPLIPAIRPLTRASMAAATPMITPPMTADHGVKEAQSTCMIDSSTVFCDRGRTRREPARQALAALPEELLERRDVEQFDGAPLHLDQ